MADGAIKTLVTINGLVTSATKGLIGTADLVDAGVTYGKLQATAAPSVLLGRGAGGSGGTVQEITLGANLTLTGTVLSASAPAGYTDEQAQDAVGGMLADTATVSLAYNDAGATITAAVRPNAIGNAQLRQAAGTSVLGRSAGGVGQLADIAAGADGTLLVRRSGALDFSTLVAGDIPGLDAAIITSGLLPVNRGGTANNLTSSGGAGQVLKQLTVGGFVSVAALLGSEIPVFAAAGGSASKGGVPQPGATAHPNVPYVLGDGSAWVQPFGRMLACNVVSTAESTTSTTAVLLTTPDRVTITLDENCNLLLIFNCNEYINTANFNVRNTFYYNGSPLSGGFDVGFSAANLAASVTHMFRVNLNAGTYTIEVYHSVPNGGQGTWYGRTLAVFLSK